MPISLDEFSDYFTGATRSNGTANATLADEMKPLMAGLSLLAETPENLALTAFLPFADEDEAAPLPPNAAEIEDAVNQSIARPLESSLAPAQTRREVAQSVWNELSRPLRQWFFLRVAQAIQRRVEASSPGSDQSNANTVSMQAADEPTRSRQGAPDPAVAKRAKLDMLKQIAPSEWETYVLSYYAGLTPSEISELTENSLSDVETWLAVAGASLVTGAGDFHG